MSGNPIPNTKVETILAGHILLLFFANVNINLHNSKTVELIFHFGWFQISNLACLAYFSLANPSQLVAFFILANPSQLGSSSFILLHPSSRCHKTRLETPSYILIYLSCLYCTAGWFSIFNSIHSSVDLYSSLHLRIVRLLINFSIHKVKHLISSLHFLNPGTSFALLYSAKEIPLPIFRDYERSWLIILVSAKSFTYTIVSTVYYFPFQNLFLNQPGGTSSRT